MLQQADIISKLPINTIKLHQLQIIKGTRFEHEYKVNPDEFSLFEMAEYIEFIVSFVERLHPKIVIERFSSESPPRYVVAPEWGLIRYDEMLRLIEKRMEDRNTWQGRIFNGEL
jgi:radical SAM superfamily enzyme